ncbi:uroporphyrinogen-III C-methyltransferase NDAI_0H00620 [Naumovozyma dairenensis CBS 421]|uniref:uroporphyrinogen-III C-methyltransferase n=1 Tax=Naumovozyma dairenensis (strain ATCC 10597 / BCRC 20456 / CBS 421 / NBRC 0211 / NRRL Y-12639) TaxID=1071378 RepID=G0WEM5_NAUDC|nr:hypothetical protein NDAI_0H00620 [Naumovozyma dairenensis CBS 421]CCD26236.1 hypothetical protein NDAI_0H00620 [Naumovozyma dairenensis CBS 421]
MTQLYEPIPLITSTNSVNEVHLLIGTGEDSCSQTIRKAKSILKSGASPIIINPTSQSHYKKLSIEFAHDPNFKLLNRPFQLSDLTQLGRKLVSNIVDRVFINLPPNDTLLARDIHNQCIKLRIPINTFQRPEYSTFTMLPTYIDPKGSGLQISVTTNGRGYILANRIKREIVNNLPSNISEIVTNMGQLRDQIINEDHKILLNEKFFSTELSINKLGYGLDNDSWESHKFNKLIKEFEMTSKDQKLKRTRWLSQIMEYYPLSKLADITIDQLSDTMASGTTNINTNKKVTKTPTDDDDFASIPSKQQKLSPSPSSGEKVQIQLQEKETTTKSKGSISLVGAGPGSISMLTIGALHEIKTADLILTDKLVPQAVLDLIPPETETFIARKFPGNAEHAQQELLQMGLTALQNDKKVVRLKQGDPYIFGRGGEEFLFFQENGFEPIVLPGLSSSLASTVVSKIPATQRAIADQVLICTGTGRKGSLPVIPEFVRTRTTVFLMALHRSEELIDNLIKNGWDGDVPAAIVERASCPDQRVTRTKLKYVPQVIEEIGSRPPGLLVVGNAVNALIRNEYLNSLDSSSSTSKYYMEEGYKAFEINDLSKLF